MRSEPMHHQSTAAWTAVLVFLLVVSSCSDRRQGGFGDDDDSDTVYDGPPIPETCSDAIHALTSVGCEFFVADMDNWNDPSGSHPDADPLNYSLVVSNPQQTQNAQVTIENGNGDPLISLDLAPGALEVIDLACASGCLVPQAEVNIQGLGPGSGFRLTSNTPITAYQWNPYGQEIFTTDASLLIPVTALSGTYIVASWPTTTDDNLIVSQVMIVATQNATAVRITPSATITAYGGVGPISAGDTSSAFNLDAADVLTLRTQELGSDLTGSVIEADKPLAVFGGNNCASVPADGLSCCCDHVEEQLLPLEAWGTSTVLARPSPRATCSENTDLTLWRLIAGAANMTISFDPPAPAPYGNQHHFDSQGELIEFLSPTDHFASGIFDAPANPDEPAAPFFAYQMMTGAQYASCGPAGDEGDPFMLLSPPAGQFLDQYVFNTDNVFNFLYDQIIVVRPAGVPVELDCLGQLPDTDFVQVGSSAWEVGRFFIDDPSSSTPCQDGAHQISSTQPFGLSVVGTASFQSYGYLGGVGIKPINPNPVIQ